MPSNEVMSKFKHGALHSGSKSGPVVKNRKQAEAILMSEQRTEVANGGTYPEHHSRGRVSSVHEHHGGKHVTIEVTHGKRKRVKGKDGEPGELVGYDRPHSSVTVPKSAAAKYPVGAKVRVGITPDMGENDQDGDEGENDDQYEYGAGMNDEDGDEAPAPKKSGKNAAKKGAKSPAKRSGPRPILSAMTRGRRS